MLPVLCILMACSSLEVTETRQLPALMPDKTVAPFLEKGPLLPMLVVLGTSYLTCELLD